MWRRTTSEAPEAEAALARSRRGGGGGFRRVEGNNLAIRMLREAY